MQSKDEYYIELRISYKSYIYLLPSERRNMNVILSSLAKEDNVTMNELSQNCGIPRCTIKNIIWLLISINVLDVRQKKLARVLYLKKDWKKRLESKLHFYSYQTKQEIPSPL